MQRRPAVRERATRAVVAVAVTAVAAAGCGSGVDDGDGAPPETDTVVVSAAASLRDAFATIAEGFEADHPGVEVRLNLASSGQLSEQILAGAPADVAAFADTAPMDALVDADRVVGAPQVFATNELVVVTRPGNPAGVDGLEDLAEAGVVALCVPTAPCGRLAEQLLDAADVAIADGRVTLGRDATATLGAVTRGDADAAVVYRTDARSAGGRVEVVEIAGADRRVARYPVAVVGEPSDDDSPHDDGPHGLAGEFVDRVLGDAGRRALRDAGFGPPPPAGGS